MGLVEVPPGVAQQPAWCCPGAAAQRLVSSKPGLRVFLVRIGNETGKGHEIVGRPLPNVADHLPAAEWAVAGGKRAYVRALEPRGVEIGEARIGSVLAPRITPLLETRGS